MLCGEVAKKLSVFTHFGKGALGDVLTCCLGLFLVAAYDESGREQLVQEVVRGECHKVKIEQGEKLTLHTFEVVVGKLELAGCLEVKDQRDLHVELFELGRQQ
jgi:hypothetical protein